jgi:CHASE2 domain-containing sensor protein
VEAQNRFVPRSNRRGYLRSVGFVAVGLGLTGLVLLAFWGRVFRGLESSTVDTRFGLRGDQTAPKDVAVVGIDDATFSALELRWPLPRSYEGRLITRLYREGARVIAVDLQFTEQTTTAEDDTLMSAVGGAGNVVLATSEVDSHGHTNVFGGDSSVRHVRARVGSILFPPDSDGVIRRLPYETNKLKSFSIVAAERATGRFIPASALGGKNAWIDYRGPPGSIRYASFSDVLAGKFPPGFFRGAIVVVGATGPSLQDLHPTSTTGATQMSGPEVEANAIWTALHGFPLQSTGAWLTVVLIVGFGLVPLLAGLRLGVLRALGLALVAGAAYAAATQLAFDHGHVLPVVYPLVALVLSSMGLLVSGTTSLHSNQ